MEKLHWTWKKIVSIVLGFLGIGTLTSCYGMPYIDNPDEMYGCPHNKYFVSGTVTGDTDGDGKYEPLQKIEISVKKIDIPEDGSYGGYTPYSDENGNFVVTVITDNGYEDENYNPNANRFSATFTDRADNTDDERKVTFKTFEYTFKFDEEDEIPSDNSWCKKAYKKDLGDIKLEVEDSQDKDQPDEE